MIYGPKHVTIVAGTNKITGTLEEAIHRAKNIAITLNAKIEGFNPLSVELNRCVDCLFDQ